MPNNGLIFEAEEFQLQMSSAGSASFTGTGTKSAQHGISGDTQYCVDAFSTVTGFGLSVQCEYDGTSWVSTATYNGPYAPSGGLIVTGASSSCSILVVLTGLKIYGKLTGSLWRIVWDTTQVYVDGVLQLDAGGVDESSAGTGPNYINYLGIPLSLVAGCGASVTTAGWTYDPCHPETVKEAWSSDCTSSATGGWRFKQNDVWVNLPVTPYSGEPGSSGDCPYGLGLTDILSATSTWGVTLDCTSHADYTMTYEGRQTPDVTVTRTCTTTPDEEGHGGGIVYDTSVQSGPDYCKDLCTNEFGPANWDTYKEVSHSESKGGSIRLVPDLPKTIKRMNTGYRAFWHRGEMPETRASLVRTCTVDGVTTNHNTTTTVHPAQSEIISVVGDSPHAIEDTLGYHSYAPMGYSHTKNESTTYSVYHPELCSCPPLGMTFPPCPPPPSGGIALVGYDCESQFEFPPDNTNQSEFASVSFPTYVGSYTGPQYNANDMARYLGSWPNPHWQYAHWREDWDVDSSPVGFTDYWGPIREQWLYNSALPTGEQRRTRNSLMISPGEDSGNTPWLDSFNSGLRWLGISRWKTQSITWPYYIDLTSTSEPRWTLEDCTAVFASDITLTPSASTCKASFALADMLVPPFLYPAGAAKVTLAWDTSNVSAMSVKLVGVEGSE